MVAGRVMMIGVAFLASLAVAEFGEYGEDGVTDVHGNFIPGSSGIYSQKCSTGVVFGKYAGTDVKEFV
jgi:hypothetical protein